MTIMEIICFVPQLIDTDNSVQFIILYLLYEDIFLIVSVRYSIVIFSLFVLFMAFKSYLSA